MFLDSTRSRVQANTIRGRVLVTFRRKPRFGDRNVVNDDYFDEGGGHRLRYVEETLYESVEPVWVIAVHQWFGYHTGRVTDQVEWHYTADGDFVDGGDPRPEWQGIIVMTCYDLLTLQGELRTFGRSKFGHIRGTAAQWLRANATPPKEIAFDRDWMMWSNDKKSGRRTLEEARSTVKRRSWLDAFDKPGAIYLPASTSPDQHWFSRYERPNEELFRDLLLRARSLGFELSL